MLVFFSSVCSSPCVRSPAWSRLRLVARRSRWARGCWVVGLLSGVRLGALARGAGPLGWCVVLPSVRSSCWSAFLSGGLCSLLLRPGRSGARLVLVAVFSSRAGAARFARRSAWRSGRAVVLRRSPVVGRWSVSAPVVWSSSRLPVGAGRRVFWSGGLLGFVRALGSAGFVGGVARC